MANQARLSSAAAVAALEAIRLLPDADAGAGKIIIYSAGSGVPAYANTAITDQTALATLTLNDPAFGAAAGDGTDHRAESDLDVDPAVTVASAAGSGDAAFFRITDNSGDVTGQGSVGTSGCDLNLNTVTIGTGANVSITSLQLRLPYNQA